jgi:hypothetical protein
MRRGSLRKKKKEKERKRAENAGPLAFGQQPLQLNASRSAAQHNLDVDAVRDLDAHELAQGAVRRPSRGPPSRR